jgi:hypothetical protein
MMVAAVLPAAAKKVRTTRTPSLFMRGFNLPSSGYNPNPSIVVFRNGLLYGTTYYLGTANVGSAFTLVP